MAATVSSSPWGKPGAWALDAEEHEHELKQEEDLNSQKNNNKTESDFPSLSAAAATKQPKKKKNQTLSLAEFATYSSAASHQQHEPKGLTHEDLLNLPTGPRQRSAEELDRSRLGGGFKSYGMNTRNGDDSGSSRWGSGGGNSRFSNRDNRDSSREIAPSRADEIDDWSKTKKPSSFGNERRERGSSFFDSQSKADESDSWVSNKPPMETRRFGGGGGSNGGFERRGSFDSLSRERYGSSNGGGAADSDNWGRKKEDSDGTGSGTARPKLVLQPRSLPVSNDNGGVDVKPKGSNPFGNARPREEVLAEKGKDWKEIDEKLESVKISSNKEVEKGERGNSASFGRWSFGNGRGGGSGNEPRTWRKPDGADSNSRPQSAAGSENGHASENGHNTEDEHTGAI